MRALVNKAFTPRMINALRPRVQTVADTLLDKVQHLGKYDGPLERAPIRWVADDVELGGQQLRQGDLAIAVIAAADRDPVQFSSPEALDTQRQPNRHLGFGRGAHYCLGAPLACMETEIALNTLLRRLPGLRLATPVAELEWRLVPLIRGLKSLPVAWN